MTRNHYNDIDDYLAGRLDEESSIAFEKELHLDTDLKDEFEFQRNIIEGIKVHRKAQLKSQLANVSVSPWSLFVNSTAGKAVVGVSSAVVVSTSVFLYTAAEQPVGVVNDGIEIMIDAPVAESIPSLDLPLSAKPVVVVKSEEIVKQDNEQPKIPENKTVSSIRSEEIAEKTSSSEQPAFAPSIVLPDDVSEIEDDQQLIVDEISSDVFEKVEADNDSEAVDIEIVEKKNIVLSYIYYDGKLRLIGDFGKSPYQIIEVIGADGKDLFLFYESNYYEVTSTSEVLPLIRITDESRIKELEILKNYK